MGLFVSGFHIGWARDLEREWQIYLGVFYMKTVLSFFVVVLCSANAFTQNSAEVSCRAKAKELAAQSYSSCVIEARNAQVEEIRTSYQKELSALKSKYDKELKKIGGAKAAKKSKGSPTVQEVQAAQVAPAPVTKGIAKQLPVKALRSEAEPVQSVSEGTKVVPVGADKGSDSLEKEAADADQVEIIENPAE